MTRLVIGIDGGGTSTVAWLAAVDGGVLGRGKAGPSNAKAVGPERARQALEDAIGLAFEDANIGRQTVEVICLGLAGFDRPEDRLALEGWRTESAWSHRSVLVNDGDLVVAAGTPEGWGVGLIAGTGSIAVGRAADGRKARAGGWGHLIGDEGSAYAVVLEALRLAARRADGREPVRGLASPLTDRLCEALGVEVPSRIVSALHAPGMDRTKIAGLAPVVLVVAESDPEVGAILARAGESLAELAAAVARSLSFEGGPFPLAMAGGFLLSAPLVASSLLAALEREGLRAVVTTVGEPVLGAVVLARDATLSLNATGQGDRARDGGPS